MSRLERMFKRHPVMQFARKAQETAHETLSDSFSRVGVGLGMGQGIKSNSEANEAHLSAVKQHRIHLSMMKFDMNQRSSI